MWRGRPSGHYEPATDAKLDGAPVLAITGLQYHDLIDTYTCTQ